MMKLAEQHSTEQSVTRPEQFVGYILNKRGIELPVIPQTCIISHSQGILDMACAAFPCRIIDLGARRPLPIHFLGDPERPTFAVVACPLGAPMAAVLLEELIALGFERFIAVGIAGHPAGPDGPSLAPGDLVLVDSAMIYEGTSAHYRPGIETSYPDPELTGELSQELAKHNLSFLQGSVATTDALYRETASFLQEILAKKALVIDMELSALFTVSNFHQRQLAAITYVSDVIQLGTDEWKVAFIDKKISLAEENVFKTLLSLMSLK